MKRIALVDDHTILREGLRALLSSNPDFTIAGELADGIDAVRCAAKLKPDLIVMDLSMPKMNGIEAIIEIKKQNPTIKVVVLTIHNTEEHILSALQAGADGYVLKDDSSAELEMAIKSVLKGEHYLSPGISEKVIQGYLKGKKEVKIGSAWDLLTQRERGVLQMIAEGYKNKEIADQLCISVKTVDNHRANLMKKLNLHNASDLTKYAIEKGLINR